MFFIHLLYLFQIIMCFFFLKHILLFLNTDKNTKYKKKTPQPDPSDSTCYTELENSHNDQDNNNNNNNIMMHD